MTFEKEEVEIALQNRKIVIIFNVRLINAQHFINACTLAETSLNNLIAFSTFKTLSKAIFSLLKNSHKMTGSD